MEGANTCGPKIALKQARNERTKTPYVAAFETTALQLYIIGTPFIFRASYKAEGHEYAARQNCPTGFAKASS